jgi:predicted SAM-dependent methyltransferase
LKLNLGSGAGEGLYRNLEWINADLEGGQRVHVLCDGYQLPFDDNTFDEIHCIHLLEHLARDRWPVVLEEICRTLAIGGTVFIEVPDFIEEIKGLLKAYENGNVDSQHILRTGIWGKTEQSGMGHCFGFDERLLLKAIETVGLNKVERVTDSKKIEFSHSRRMPVILVKAIKSRHSDLDIRSWSIDKLRERFWV